MRPSSPLAAAALTLAVAGCAGPAPRAERPVATSAPAAASAPAAVRYACADGSFLAVVFRGDAADVTLVDGEAATLGRSGFGARFAGSGFELRGDGDRIVWTAGRGAPTACDAT